MEEEMDAEKEKKEFKPVVPDHEKQTEFTAVSIILGVLLAVLFGGANAYLGLRVGLTVSASIPAAVISMGVIRMILKKDSILENNMVQTIGSAGESLAAGAIFTLPAIFMWAEEGHAQMPSFAEITLLGLFGGMLGVLLMIPLRKVLIVREHDNLPYPEGTACAEVLLAGEKGGNTAKTVFQGLGIAAIYKLIADGIALFPSEVDYALKKVKGVGLGVDVLPALAGVGFICGIKVSSYMFAGGIIAWLALMPAIATFAGETVLYPGVVPINAMGTWDIWSNYIRYIGAGAVATGGIISLIKSLPMIIRTFGQSMASLKHKEAVDSSELDEYGNVRRTFLDVPFSFVLIGIALIGLLMWLLPIVPIDFAGAVFIVIFGFFFATVSSRMVGTVGSSNNPVSGMAIATLLMASVLLKISGNGGYAGMIAAIAIGTVICIIAAMAGDTSQDLKTGYLLGATPRKQQIGEMIGVVGAALAIGAILYLLNKAWGYGTTQLPAPQATLMKMVVEGVMEGNLPWSLVMIGAMIAIAVEILQVPVMPFAVGLYLPLHLSTAIMAGGCLRYLFEQRDKKTAGADTVEKGILYSSGLIAGEGLMGIVLAVFALIPFQNETLGDVINISDRFNLGNIGGIVFFVVLLASYYIFCTRK